MSSANASVDNQLPTRYPACSAPSAPASTLNASTSQSTTAPAHRSHPREDERCSASSALTDVQRSARGRGYALRGRPSASRDCARAREARLGAFVHDERHGTVRDEGLAGARAQEVGEEAVHEPLSTRHHRRAHADADEAVADLLDLLDPRPPDKRRRALRKRGDDAADDRLGPRAVGDEELDGELLDALRQDAHGRDLGVVDVDDLAVERLQSRAPQRDVLDDALQLVARDEDRVADGVPALGEHRKAGDDVGEDALEREADQHEHERRPGDRGEAVDAADQLREGEYAGGHEPGDRDHVLYERDERLAPLDRRDLALAELGVVVPPVVPGQNGARDDTARFREQPGGDEETDDDEDGEHGGSGGTA